MAKWNHDIAKAPRGSYRVVSAGKSGAAARKVFHRAEIIAASKCGVVTVSYWIDTEKRWNMFGAGEQPIAWMPYAGPREVVQADGKVRRVADLPAHPTMAESWFDALLREQRAAA